ncbi:MAG: OadG family protein [Ruminococcus sp.]|nr:OadG family protein [Ruminococcus sp.]
MSIPTAILTGLFCLTVVFTMLIVIWALIRTFSFVIRIFERDKTK